MESPEALVSENTLAECGIYDAYRYIGVGVGPVILIPNVAIGYRERYGTGLGDCPQFFAIGYAHQLSAR